MSDSLPFSISLDQALTGPGAADKGRYASALSALGTELGALKKAYADGSLELLRIAESKDDLERGRELAETFCRNSSDIVVLGIGGSSLGGRALQQACRGGSAAAPRVTFVDNPDPLSFERALSAYDLKTTRFVVISKSGGTAEPLALALCAAGAIDRAGGGKYLKHHFAAITEPRHNVLRRFAEDIGCPTLDHPEGIGGRYAVLSNVGMFPGILMGIDVERVREGAREIVNALLTSSDATSFAPAQGAALHHALALEGRLRETVLWSYADRLSVFAEWWRQLWAESLGKDGKGSTPIPALGPVDQHSQLQLYLDGPGGALFSLVSTQTGGKGPQIPRERAEAIDASYLAGHSLGDLVDAEIRATAATLHKRGRPVRRIEVPEIDARAVGALFMHFMLETILMGRLMGVDPFDQPAVEEGKVLARRYLEGKIA